MTKKDVARINFEIDKTLFDRLQTALPWGFRTNLLRILLEKVADASEKHGEIMIGAFLSGEYTIEYRPAEAVQAPDALGEKSR